MPMIKCDKQLHIYNNDEYGTCPICEVSSAQPDVGSHTQPIQNEIHNHDLDDNQNTVGWPNGGNGDNKTDEYEETTPWIDGSGANTTVMLSGDDTYEKNETLPVAGWLVITQGDFKGRDFRLIQGLNNIGRGKQNEVCLDFGDKSDKAISRDAHATIVYDNRSNEFFIEKGRSRNLPALNGKTVRDGQDLSSGDIIEVGETQLMFVPFCQGEFKW